MRSIKLQILILIVFILVGCQANKKGKSKDNIINQTILASLGTKHKNEFAKGIDYFNDEIEKDSTNVNAYVGLAESYILLHVFGYISNAETMPDVKRVFQKAKALDPFHSEVLKLSGIINFLDWNWKAAEHDYEKAIEVDPNNLNARHWYELYLMAMKRVDEAMIQSDLINEMDENNNFLVARASMFYFLQRFEDMKPLMHITIALDHESPWAYDWLGMAYNGLEEHDAAIKTYIKAFELSDGTVEVGGGLGHALAHAGETKLAKQMADYYSLASKERYMPPVQRSFIHLGLGENEKALDLLEQAYNEHSWFLSFMQIEHWYDPIRKDKRFIEIMSKMNFTNN